MAHYAYISNAEFTTTERARLREVENEIDVIRQDNIDSEGYQLLYSTLYPTVTNEDIKNAFKLLKKDEKVKNRKNNGNYDKSNLYMYS